MSIAIEDMAYAKGTRATVADLKWLPRLRMVLFKTFPKCPLPHSPPALHPLMAKLEFTILMGPSLAEILDVFGSKFSLKATAVCLLA